MCFCLSVCTFCSVLIINKCAAALLFGVHLCVRVPCVCVLARIALEFVQIDCHHLARMLITRMTCCERDGTYR